MYWNVSLSRSYEGVSLWNLRITTEVEDRMFLLSRTMARVPKGLAHDTAVSPNYLNSNYSTGNLITGAVQYGLDRGSGHSA